MNFNESQHLETQINRVYNDIDTEKNELKSLREKLDALNAVYTDLERSVYEIEKEYRTQIGEIESLLSHFFELLGKV